MLTLSHYLFESIKTPTSSVGGILHIEHPSDTSFDGRDAAYHALNVLRGAAKGSTPVSRKIDDKLSFQAIKHPDGRVGVKYKGPGSHYNYSSEDIDNQHGHKPYLSHPLKLLLEHLPKVLPDHPGEWQGGYLSSPAERKVINHRISHQPNTIQYSIPTDTQEGARLRNSKVSAVIHSELVGPNRQARPITDTSEFKQHPDVHLVSPVVSHEEQHDIDPVTKRAALKHLNQAEKIMQGHTWDHTAGHEATLRKHINSLVTSGGIPSTEDYTNFLKAHHQKMIDDVKLDKTKQAKKIARDAAVAHVLRNKKAFDKSFRIHGHIQAATNLLARGLGKVAHGGYHHHIDGKETGPEGFVAGGLKIVDRGEGGFTAGNRASAAIRLASPKLAKKVA